MHAYKIGRFLGHYYGQQGKSRIVIGKDTRRSGYMLEYAIASGICASGADAYLLHVTTTPCVSFCARTEGFDCGVMISASHNPYSDNGIKLVDGLGEKMPQDIIDKVEEYLDTDDDLSLAEFSDIGRTVDYSEGRNRYCGYLISQAKNSYKGISVGLDCSNGSSWMLAKSVFDALGARTQVINNSPDGFNINLDCGSTHIEGLCELVKREKLDIGFAFDGDADRCLAVDCAGNVLTGDHILYMCAKYMKKNAQLENNTVVATVMSDMGLVKALEREEIKISLTDVGDKYIYEEMSKNGYSLGGEESGHIIFSKCAATGDGILTAIKIMEVMIEEKQPSSKLCDGFVPYPRTLINVAVNDKDAVMNDTLVAQVLEDERKVLGNDGRLILRKSGTEPVIRVMCEAASEKTCSDSARRMAQVIRRISG